MFAMQAQETSQDRNCAPLPLGITFSFAGHVQSRVVYFLMNIHVMQRSIYLTRHGESEFNRMERIGGDAPLTSKGLRYAAELAKYFAQESVRDLRSGFLLLEGRETEGYVKEYIYTGSRQFCVTANSHWVIRRLFSPEFANICGLRH